LACRWERGSAAVIISGLNLQCIRKNGGQIWEWGEKLCLGKEGGKVKGGWKDCYKQTGECVVRGSQKAIILYSAYKNDSL